MQRRVYINKIPFSILEDTKKSLDQNSILGHPRGNLECIPTRLQRIVFVDSESSFFLSDGVVFLLRISDASSVRLRGRTAAF